MTRRLPLPRLVARDPEVLERRARELATGHAGEEDGAAGLLRLVSFRLLGAPCAVELAAVERALVLSAAVPIPLADGSERAVAYVDERPLPVVDLAGTAAGAARAAAELGGVPALVVVTPAGGVAVAVDGPLELAEDRLAAASGAGEGGVLRVAGRLAAGGSLLDAGWLCEWAGKAARP